MAFNPPVGRIPTEIIRVQVGMFDQKVHVPHHIEDRQFFYRLVVLDQDGETIHFAGEAGDLLPHLEGNEESQLNTFIESIRTRSEIAILP